MACFDSYFFSPSFPLHRFRIFLSFYDLKPCDDRLYTNLGTKICYLNIVISLFVSIV